MTFLLFFIPKLNKNDQYHSVSNLQYINSESESINENKTQEELLKIYLQNEAVAFRKNCFFLISEQEFRFIQNVHSLISNS